GPALGLPAAHAVPLGHLARGRRPHVRQLRHRALLARPDRALRRALRRLLRQRPVPRRRPGHRAGAATPGVKSFFATPESRVAKKDLTPFGALRLRFRASVDLEWRTLRDAMATAAPYAHGRLLDVG